MKSLVYKSYILSVTCIGGMEVSGKNGNPDKHDGVISVIQCLGIFNICIVVYTASYLIKFTMGSPKQISAIQEFSGL